MFRPALNRPLAAYVISAVYLSCVGWLLSIFHVLTPFALAFSVAVGLGGAAVWCWKTRRSFHMRLPAPRWKRLFPILYLTVVLLVLLSGALHSENFQDALAYKIPRCLQWLHEKSWYWIPTYDVRQNNRGCVYEWMSLPILALSHSDRFLFLINYIALLLFPSLLFQTLRLLGVAGRTAWMWMWIWPTAAGFVCQSATASNDFLGGFFVLAAINFGLLYSQHLANRYLYLSVLAFGLATGVKALNLLLAPPWMIALLPGLWHGTRPSPRIVGLVFLCVAFSSFLPNGAINWIVSHNFLASNLEPYVFKPATSHFTRLIISGPMLVAQNFYPYYFPGADALNLWLNSILKSSSGAYLIDHFESGLFLVPGDFAHTDETGLGFFLSLLVTASLIYGLWHRLEGLPWRDWRFYISLTSLVSFLFFISLSDLAQVARLAIPYYTLVLPLLLYGTAQLRLTRLFWWRVLAVLPMIAAILFLLTWPVRPILPMGMVLSGIEKITGPIYPVNLLQSMYINGAAPDAGYDWLNDAIPSDIHRVGIVREWYEPEAPFWRPFGARRVITVAQTETPESIRQHGLTYIVVSRHALEDFFGIPSDDWLKKFHGRVVASYGWKGATWQVIVLSVYVAPDRAAESPDSNGDD